MTRLTTISKYLLTGLMVVVLLLSSWGQVFAVENNLTPEQYSALSNLDDQVTAIRLAAEKGQATIEGLNDLINKITEFQGQGSGLPADITYGLQREKLQLMAIKERLSGNPGKADELLNQAAGYSQSAKATTPQFHDSLGNCSSSGYLSTDCVLSIVSSILSVISDAIAAVVKLAGLALDKAMDISVRNFGNYAGSAGVTVAWQTLRNVTNMVLIFILLYVAITMILQLGSDKRIIVAVLTVALLVNFSAFFTKVVIDASNVVANEFYRQIATAPCAGGNSNYENSGSPIGNGIACRLQVQKFYAYDPNNPNATPEGNSWGTIIKKQLGNIIILLVAAFVLGAGALLLLLRTIDLLIVIILSPAAFLAYATPGLKSHFSQWTKKLLNAAFFAPIMFFFIFLTFKMVDNGMLEGLENEGMIGTVIRYAILLAFLTASITMAKKFGARGADSAMGWGNKLKGFATGAVVGGVAGGLARNTVGRWANNLAQSNTVQKMAARMPILGGRIKSGIEGVAGAKFGGKKGFKQKIQERAKNVEQFKKNPQQQAQYLSSLGGLTSRLPLVGGMFGLGLQQQRAAYEKLSNDDKVKLDKELGKKVNEVEDNDDVIKTAKQEINNKRQELTTALTEHDEAKVTQLRQEITVEQSKIDDRRRDLTSATSTAQAAETIKTRQKELATARLEGRQADVERLEKEIKSQQNLVDYGKNRQLKGVLEKLESRLPESDRAKIGDIRKKAESKEERKDKLKKLKRDLEEKLAQKRSFDERRSQNQPVDEREYERTQAQIEKLETRIEQLEELGDVKEAAEGAKDAASKPAGGGEEKKDKEGDKK